MSVQMVAFVGPRDFRLNGCDCLGCQTGPLHGVPCGFLAGNPLPVHSQHPVSVIHHLSHQHQISQALEVEMFLRTVGLQPEMRGTNLEDQQDRIQALEHLMIMDCVLLK